LQSLRYDQCHRDNHVDEKKLRSFVMKRFWIVALFGLFCGSHLVFGQGEDRLSKIIEIGEIRVWKCEDSRELSSGNDISFYAQDRLIAKRLQSQLSFMSSIHWALGQIRPSVIGDVTVMGPALFRVGVYEDSRIPSIQEIVAICRRTVECGELVVGERRYPF